MPRTPPTAKSKEIGARLRALRKQRGGTQADIAEEIGIDRGTLAGIETGAAHPGRETMANLAKFYSVSLDYLDRGAAALSDDLSAEAIQDASEASLVRFWRILERAQKDDLMVRIAEMIGSRFAADDARQTHHRPPPNNANAT